MQRRKFLIGLGSLAAGTAAATGTGAFNFANVERDGNMQVSNGSNAFLALKPESDYARQGNNGIMALAFDDTAGVTGTGIQQSSDYSFTGVFSITNQGSQPVGVWIEDDDGNDTVNWYATDSEDKSDFGTSMEGSGNAYPLDVGETVFVNVTILTRKQSRNYRTLPDTVNIKADASAGSAE
ncbi:DUF1102 domain-containing protein [Haloarcula sp. 1CSR25-25]|uniref:DUF1102 domain-containing protein n=1 Tax=Haloarcula sp. 1CSR25-25 TaxID=2862545 RepID=UPI002895785D|nr:DUF1102 domain-containing protein [Haloarcula sp. 1CSR25-25]MDT3435510.1 DUF1102 domain-containing protein [Haloarcula sp. 1CSR25-25]